MLPFFSLTRACLLAFVVCMASGSAVTAQQDPPISISGFKYSYHETGGIHMNVCEGENCVPGSKVSYTLHAPEPEPDFEWFKSFQSSLEATMKAKLPKGTVVKFDEPKQESTDRFTLFTNTRMQKDPDGTVRYTKSTFLFTKAVTISLISSSDDEGVIVANYGLFLIGLLAWSAALEKAN